MYYDIPILNIVALTIKNNTMNNLSLYGWNELLLEQKRNSIYKDFVHGRISITHKTCYEVISEMGDYTCELTGNMIYGRDKVEFPCTGDWVIFQPIDTDKGIIYDILPRQKTLYRLKSGRISEKQAIASHVDKGFIVQSLDQNFNVRRIERFMIQLADENIQPVLVFTKSDLEFNKNDVEESLNHLAHKIPIFYTSVHFPDTIEKLREYILIGETVVFTGSSGVGKSTLINKLCKQEVLLTNSISSATGKGKHTTTRREMVMMGEKGILIDTPGIKVFGVTNDDADTLSRLMDINSFTEKCRFKDCQHMNEAGCAVIKAVEDGELDRGVYENFLKLRKEAWHYSTSVHEKRKVEKSFSKMVKNVKKNPFKKF